MLAKDKTYTRDVHMMEKHPHLLPKMRAILLDWLMEVCNKKCEIQCGFSHVRQSQLSDCLCVCVCF